MPRVFEVSILVDAFNRRLILGGPISSSSNVGRVAAEGVSSSNSLTVQDKCKN